MLRFAQKLPRFKHYFSALLCGLALTACGLAGTVYQSIPKLAIYELDGMLDLSGAQYDAAAPQLDALYQWHRKNELPAAVALLKSTAASAERGVSSGEVQAVFDAVWASTRRLQVQSQPPLVALLQTFTPSNLATLKKKHAKDNAKYRKEWLSLSLDDAQEKRFDTFLTWAQRIYGDLNAEQKQRLRTASNARVLRRDWVLQERQHRQAQLEKIALMGVQKSPATAINAAIADYAAHFERGSTPESQAYAQQSRAQTAALIALLSQIATPEQRREAKKTLLGYAQTFQSLNEAP